jgi:hypothetical protein
MRSTKYTVKVQLFGVSKSQSLVYGARACYVKQEAGEPSSDGPRLSPIAAFPSHLL